MNRIYLAALCCIFIGSSKAQVTTQSSSKPLLPAQGKFGGQAFYEAGGDPASGNADTYSQAAA